MASNSTMIHKLQSAINGKGGNILYNTSQFFSKDQNRPVTIYHVKKSIWDEEEQILKNKELFRTTSQIQVVLYLRDYWNIINGQPIPTDNEEWEQIKKEKHVSYTILERV